MPLEAIDTSDKNVAGTRQPLGNDGLMAAERLHRHLLERHWDGHALVGPDPVGKINWRITRFLRSYLSFVPWRDRYTFLQAQGYWIKSNLELCELTGNDSYLEFVRSTADHILRIQRPDGSWNYSLPERRHLVGIPECMWAGLGLLAAHQQFGDERYLEAARNWYRYHVNEMGFVTYEDGHVPNYYNRPGAIIPNVAALTMRFSIELSRATDDTAYLNNVDKMVRFLPHGQRSNGEIEYVFQMRPHFQCFQYNAYEFLDLASSYEYTGDERLLVLLDKMARYLSGGVTERGSCRYDCHQERPEVNYWSAAIADALHKAHELQLGDYLGLSERAYRYLLSRQNPDGSFAFSTHNYRVLRDSRSYPRTSVMILKHLLARAFANR